MSRILSSEDGMSVCAHSCICTWAYIKTQQHKTKNLCYVLASLNFDLILQTDLICGASNQEVRRYFCNYFAT